MGTTRSSSKSEKSKRRGTENKHHGAPLWRRRRYERLRGPALSLQGRSLLTYHDSRRVFSSSFFCFLSPVFKCGFSIPVKESLYTLLLSEVRLPVDESEARLVQ